MPFNFHPKHEYNCPNVSHCRHLGGAALCPLVVLRKITYGHRSHTVIAVIRSSQSYGHRSHAGAIRRGRLMTVAETAKRHGHRPSDFYQGLLPTTTTPRRQSAVVTIILAQC